ncbi:MAG: penicillin acylase family protein [bacterium]|nr:penicillin acylase family protein [bacterium]
MARTTKVLIGAILLLTLLLGGSIAGALWFVRRSLPPLEGQLAVAVTSLVTVDRDGCGVPHIHAVNIEDLLFVQGYLHAQDRLFQMDLSRRAAAGRLAEIFGPDLLEADKFLRTLGLLRAAVESEAGLSPANRAALHAYAAGVNAFIQGHQDRLPLEFTLLGYSPGPWHPTDSLGIGKYMAWDLGANMMSEIFYWQLALRVGPERAATLFPTYPEDGPVIISRLRSLPAGPGVAEGLARLQEVTEGAAPGQFKGSNSWVLAGSMTASGRPILANDMHLGMGAPSIWYQNRLVVQGRFDVTGVIFPGVPGVIVGHNGHIAWGVTNLGPDVQDLYLERRHPEDPGQFEYEGEWYRAVVERHQIRVKGQPDPVSFEVHITRHGPLISDVVTGLDVPASLRWTALEATGEASAVLGLADVRDWDGFRQALSGFAAPAQNFVFADRAGNIGYLAAGRFPVRRAGDGLVPVPGWTGDYEWVGFVPEDELPQLYNPAEDYIVTANNRVTGPDYPFFLSHQWAPPYRARTIIQELEGRHELTLEDMIPIQNSWANRQAAELGPILLGELSRGELQEVEAAARDELERWLQDPRDDPEAAGPAIFHTLYLKMLAAVFLDELGEDLYRAFLHHGGAINSFDRMLREGRSPWFADLGSVVRDGFRMAVAELEATLGRDPTRWEWGQIHTITFGHPLGSQKPLHLIFDRGPHALGGSHVTPGAASFDLATPFAVTSSAPWRYLVDLGDLRGLDIAAIGVSGHPFSVHYDDQMVLWLKGEYKPLLYGKQAKDHVVATTVFRPR